MYTLHSARGGKSKVVSYASILKRAYYFPGTCSEVPAHFGFGFVWVFFFGFLWGFFVVGGFGEGFCLVFCGFFFWGGCLGFCGGGLGFCEVFLFLWSFFKKKKKFSILLLLCLIKETEQDAL